MKEEKKDSFLKNYLVDTAAGTVSGAGAALATHPLDTETVRAQNNKKGGPKGKKITGIRGRKLELKHLNTPYGRKKLKAIVRDRYSGFGPRLKKTTIAGAIGYPLFTGSQRAIEETVNKIEDLDWKEKNASLLNAARTSFKHLGNFASGVTGTGNFKKQFATAGGLVGTGALATAFMTAPTAREGTTLEKTVKGIPDLKPAGSQKVTSSSRFSKLGYLTKTGSGMGLAYAYGGATGLARSARLSKEDKDILTKKYGLPENANIKTRNTIRGTVGGGVGGTVGLLLGSKFGLGGMTAGSLAGTFGGSTLATNKYSKGRAKKILNNNKQN